MPTLTAAQAATAYAWTDADLALLYPNGWDDPAAIMNGADAVLMLDGGDLIITLVVMPASTTDAERRSTVDAQLAALDLLPLRYDAAPLYGRASLRVEAVSADRQQTGIGQAGQLPDSRSLIIAARAPQAGNAALDDALDLVLNSLVLSASLPPVAPGYHPVWSTTASDQIYNGLAITGDRLYVLDATVGIDVLNPETGAVIAQYPFENPAQPTGLAVDGAGIVYIGDAVCRCVRRLNADGAWLENVGSFGGGAPLHVAAADDGTIYAVDQTDAGYGLQVLGEPRRRTVSLNFNASAPPLLVMGAGRAWVIEWLSSLIDGSTSAAVSQVSGGDKPAAELRYWLQGMSPALTPEHVGAAAVDGAGDLVLATDDQGALIVSPQGQVIDHFALTGMPHAAAFGADGTIYVAADGVISAYSTRGEPDRWGGAALAFGVPVQGTVSEAAPEQQWTYAGTAGETVTISAVDLARGDVYGVGLDMALHLIAPDGSEIAGNDDQLGADLFGIYDAQIPDFTLPETGTYTIRVEWRQGRGTYTLGISGDRLIQLSADGVTAINGRLQEVFPVQRWTFAGRAGDVLTITMETESGTLDPALELHKPDGSLLAYNDDAYDPELDVNAQLTQVRLPEDGLYTLRAGRYDGAGRYRIVIVQTE